MGLQNRVRQIYIVIIACLLVVAVWSVLQYRKENKKYLSEKAALQQIWDDHNKKVKESTLK